MKIRKRADQQNFTINTDNYTERELLEMFANKEIAYIDWKADIHDMVKYDWNDLYYTERKEKPPIIFADDCTEVKVICHDGFYTNVVIGKNGKSYFIEL